MSLEKTLAGIARDRSVKAACSLLESGIKEKKIVPDQISIRGLAEACYGDGWARNMHDSLLESGRSGLRMLETDQRNLVESNTGIPSTAFPNLTGQLIISAMVEQFEQPDLIGDRLVRVQNTRLVTELIPGISPFGNQIREVAENGPYPQGGMVEVYQQTGRTKKRGLIVQVTKEAIFHDQTGMILDQARDVGENMALDKEERILDAVVGANDANTLYNWNGTSYNTYLTSGLYTNAGTTTLSDWTDLDECHQLWVDMTDPSTGKRIRIRPTALLVVPHLAAKAWQIMNATFSGHESDPSSALNQQMRAGNPITGVYGGVPVLTSHILYDRLLKRVQTNTTKAKTFWWYGAFDKAFVYRQNWGLQVSQSAANADAAFYNDVDMAFKVSEKAEVFVKEPRHVIRQGDAT